MAAGPHLPPLMKPLALLQTNNAGIVQVAKAIVPPALWQFAYRRLIVRDIPDAERYGMVYQPWRAPAFEAQYEVCRQRTLVRAEACYHLQSRLRQSLQVPGAVYELGVYKGGTARLLKETLQGSGRPLRLFDTFAGMEVTNAAQGDRHRVGDFADTSLESVRAFVGSDPWIDYRPGWVPHTFGGLEAEPVAFAHIDLDLHDPIRDACEYIYPRLSSGGVMVFDDYGFPSTPGARRAVDDFFAGKREVPMVLQTGQAIVTKL
jgi:O-methyltransferase